MNKHIFLIILTVIIGLALSSYVIRSLINAYPDKHLLNAVMPTLLFIIYIVSVYVGYEDAIDKTKQ